MGMNRMDYYGKTFVLFELVKNLYKRELSFLDTSLQETKRYPVRCIKAWTVDYLKKNFERFRLWEKNYNLYYSVACLKEMPSFSFNLKKRKQEQENFKAAFSLYIEHYDFVFDLDNPDLKEAHRDAKKLKEFFDLFEVPYSVRYSGNKGFHFAISGDFFPRYSFSQVKLFEAIALRLKKGIPSIDSSIYDERRILKLPYSLVAVNGHENVVLPLNEKQFENFDVKDMEVNNVMRDVHLMNRGNLVRKGSEKNVSEFLKYFGGNENEFAEIR